MKFSKRIVSFAFLLFPLCALPARAPTSRPVEPDEDLPVLNEYHGDAVPEKEQLILRLAAAKYPNGIRILTKLWVAETDQDLRTAIFTALITEDKETDPLPHVVRWQVAVSMLLADGNVATAETLLNAVVDKKANDSARAYAAYWASRGRLDEAIRRWSGRGGRQPADTWAELILATLYRAKGDVASAISHAEVADDSAFLRETLLWSGDWAKLAANLRKDAPAPQTPHDLAMLIGVNSLAGDEKAVDAEVARLTPLINSESEAHDAADAMMLVNRPDLAAKTLLASQQFSAVYELLNDRGRFDEAAALLAAHDGETSAEAMELRAVAAKNFARLGLKAKCREMVDRVNRENADTKFPLVLELIAEAERDIGLTDQSWGHFSDAVEGVSDIDTKLQYVSRAFPAKENGVDWARVWYASNIRRRRVLRAPGDLFDRIRREYDGSMPVEELVALLKRVDLSADQSEPLIRLAWEAAVRMKKQGHEDVAINFTEDLALRAQGADLYVDLGDWAAEKSDWAVAIDRYSWACHKDPTNGLAQYLLGWAMERGGQIIEGRERMKLAHVIPLGDDKLREEMINGLLARRLDDAAIREADILIRTGHPLSTGTEVALRAAADRSDERGSFAVAAALWQRTMLSFLNGTYFFRSDPGYLHMPDIIRRSHARALLAAGDMAGAQRDIELSLAMLGAECEIAIDIVPDLDKLGKHQEADALYKRVATTTLAICDRYPDSALHHNDFAWLAAKCNRDLDKALVHAKRAVELEPANSAVIDTLAEVYFHMGKFKEAVELEKKCVELSPEMPIHRKQLERFEAGK